MIPVANVDSSLIKMTASDLEIEQKASLHEGRSRTKFERDREWFFSFQMQFFDIVWGGKALWSYHKQ